MAGKTINPTRMELTRLKAKQKTALRGHKLLKDKRDGLMKQFMQEVRRTRQLRKRVEEGLAQANAAFTVASAVMSPEMLEQALMAPRLSTEVTVDQRNIMSIAVPVFHRAEQEAQPDLACYGFAQTSGELDDALQALNRVYSDLLELAQAEKTVQLLAQDIERTRRRVNALEYVVIPENQRNIRYITMKLEENERGNTTRLMKVKDMLLKEAIEEKLNPWGITIIDVEIRDIVIPQELQEVMSTEAQAEREKNARMVLAEVEKDISSMLVDAAHVYEENEVSLRLRTMHLLYESVKGSGGTVVIPSAYSEGFSDAALKNMADSLKTPKG